MDRFLLVVFLCINWSSLTFSQTLWTYIPNAVLGPANWGGDCSTGIKQSPIDIKSAETILDEGLGVFTLRNYNKKLNKTFSGSNNGHALEMTFPAGVYNVSGGGLTGVYTTVQFHFHWGPKNSVGSEHTVNGKQYAAELHFVSFNTKYANLSQAINHEDGLAVLGLLIEVGDRNNSAFSFLENARELTESYSSMRGIPAFRFDTLLPANKTKYFRYSGSLTIPTCKEAVTWTVFKDAVSISQYQINLLRSLKKNYTRRSVGNFRPVQPLNDRIIKSSVQIFELNVAINTTANTTSGGNVTATTTTRSNTTTTTTTDGTTTRATDSAPVPTVDFEAGSSAVSMTASLFLSMLFPALFALS